MGVGETPEYVGTWLSRSLDVSFDVILSAAVFQAERMTFLWPYLWQIPHAAEVRRVSG
jgi:hypothetical protein